jgi:hypothetical protein
MADEKTVLIQVEIERSEAQKGLEQTTRALLDNKKAIDELNKSFKAGQTTTDEYVRESVRLKREQAELAAKSREYNKQLDAESNSLNALKLRLAELTKERNNVNQGTEEGVRRAEELTAAIKETSDAIKAQEEAGGDFRRNVGNYASGFQDAAKQIKVFGVGLEGINAILKANVFVLLVDTLLQLINIFKQSQTGMELFRKGGAALNAIFGKLSDAIEFVVNLVIDLIKGSASLGDKLKKLGEFIVDNIINRFKSVLVFGEAISLLFEGKFSEAATKAADAVIQLNTGITDGTAKMKAYATEVADAANRAAELEDALIALEKQQADNAVEFAKARGEMERLKFISEDASKSLAEREAAARKAFEIENEQLQRSIKLQEERIAILKAQNDITNSTETYLQKVRDAEIELANLQRDSFGKQTEFNNKINAFNKERLNGIKAQKDAEAALIQFRLEQQIKEADSIEKRIEKEIELEDAKRKHLLSQDNLLASQRKLINEQYEAKIKAIREQGALDKQAIDDKIKESEFNLSQFRIQQEIERSNRLLENKANTLDETLSLIDYKLQQEIALEEASRQRLLENEELNEAERQLIIAKSEAKITELNRNAEQTRIAEKERAAEIERQLNEQRIAEKERAAEIERQLDEQRVAVTAQTLGQVANIFEKNTAAYKLFASTQALIDTYKAANAAYASVVGVPVVGPVLAPIAAAAAVAAGIKNVEQINAAAGGGDFITTKPTLLLVGDNPGGRERVTVEPLSGRGATRINPASGLIAMAGGGTLTTDATLTRGLSNNVLDSFNQQALLDAVMNMPPPVVAVKEITKADNRVVVKESVKNI